MPIKDSEIGWLAGILDGEGCIMLTLPPSLNRHMCRVTINNTNMGILEEVGRLLTELSIFYTPYRLRTRSNFEKKPCYVIEVCRQIECKTLLERLLPYLKDTNKRSKAIELITYLENYERRDGRKSNRRKKR